MYIVGALLSGWILQLFGFDHVVQTGMLEVFGKTISHTGYYFLFGTMGALRSIFGMVGQGFTKAQKTQDKVDNWSNKILKKK